MKAIAEEKKINQFLLVGASFKKKDKSWNVPPMTILEMAKLLKILETTKFDFLMARVGFEPTT